MKFTSHELLWHPGTGVSELRSTRGLLIGAIVEMGGSWQCVLLGSIIAVRPDEETAQKAVTDALTILEAQQLLQEGKPA